MYLNKKPANTKTWTIDYQLPDKILSNEELTELFPNWDAAKIEKKIGIQQRHIVAEKETALDLAVKASQKLLSRFDIPKIDFLLLCTQSPDYFLPTSACILQDKLGLDTNIGALDFNLGCSGFIYGLALSKSLIRTGIAKNILLVMAETYTKHIHPKDKANRSIFGDGAAATIVSQTEQDKILEFELGTDGSGMGNLIVTNGAFRNKHDIHAKEIIDSSGNIFTNNNLYMNGPEIFGFTIEKLPAVVANCLKKNNYTISDIDFIIFHQANKYMLEYLRKKMKLPENKFYINLEKTGNTVSASIPIALKDCLDSKKIKSGDKVLLVGFGVGYSWGATIVEI
jgi:3-oxoacyl-[acyl-carrier-protein] synthase III